MIKKKQKHTAIYRQNIVAEVYLSMKTYITKVPYIMSGILILGFLLLAHPWFLDTGMIIFGDLDMWFIAETYHHRIFPLRNEQRSTNNFFNLSRILYLLPFFGLIELGLWAIGFQKLLIMTTLWIGSMSCFLMCRKFVRTYYNDLTQTTYTYHILFWIILAISILYMNNAFAIMRIQHFYLLVGYALLPAYMYMLRVFTDKISIYTQKTHSICYKDIFLSLMLCAIVLVIMSASIHILFFALWLTIWWYIYLSIWYLWSKNFKQRYILTWSMGLYGIIFLWLFARWWLPYIQSSLIGDITPKNVNTYDTIHMFSRFSDIWSVLTHKSYRRPMMPHTQFWSIFDIWYGILRMIALLGIYALPRTYKRYIIWVLLMSIILSTWTYYTHIAPYFLSLIFDNPVANKIGFIFRDPNKIVTLTILCFVIVVTIGTCHIVQWLHTTLFEAPFLIHQYDAVPLRYKKYRERKNMYHRLCWLCSMGIIFLCLIVCIPTLWRYTQYFYTTIDIPNDRQQYATNHEGKDTYTLFLPRYERISLPWYGFAITKRNDSHTAIKKPTWSLDLYASTQRTYHPLEGNTTAIWYMYDLLDRYLIHGYWTKLGSILHHLGIDSLVYHEDIYSYDTLHQRQQNILTSQEDLEKHYSSWFIHTYTPTYPATSYMQKDPPIRTYTNQWFQYGWMRDWISQINQSWTGTLGWSDIQTRFVHQSAYDISTHIQQASSWDIIEIDSILSYLISLIPDKHFITPWLYHRRAHSFVWWASSMVTSTDRIYYLDKRELDDRSRWFWYDHEIIYTHVPAQLDIDVYDDIDRYGRPYFDLENVHDIQELLVANTHFNDSNINLVLEKSQQTDTIPSVKATTPAWNSPIRRMGILNPLPAKEKTWYAFELVISWDFVHKLHSKVKFLNKDNEEIDIGYIGIPSHMEHAKRIKLQAAFITPPGTETMILEIGTRENPDHQSYRRLHDLTIKDLSNVTKENTIYLGSLDEKKYPPWVYDMYARVYTNSYGWVVDISHAATTHTINTHNMHTNKRQWMSVWLYTLHPSQPLSITSHHGFNALNTLLILPKWTIQGMQHSLQEKEDFVFPWKQIQLIEPELDCSLAWNKQSRRPYLGYSNGKSINMDIWSITCHISIIKPDTYDISLLLNTRQTYPQGNYTLRMYNTTQEKEELVLTTNDITNISKYLPIGNYRIDIEIQDSTQSLVDQHDIIRLKDPLKNDIYYVPEDSWETDKRKKLGLSYSAPHLPRWFTDFEYLEDEKWCSYFDTLNQYDIRYRSSGNSRTIFFPKWLTCFWLISTHDLLAVQEDDEYLISLDMQKENSKELHAKIVYYDENKQQLSGYDMIIDRKVVISNQIANYEYLVENNEMIHTEHVITTPPNTHYMRLQIWQKQRQDTDTLIQIEDLSIKRFLDLPGIDRIDIVPSSFKNTDKTNAPVMHNTPSMKHLQVHTPFSPLRKIHNTQETYTSYPSNLILNGYSIPKDTPYRLTYIPHKGLSLGVLISWTTCIWVILIYLWLCILTRESQKYCKNEKPHKDEDTW